MGNAHFLDDHERLGAELPVAKVPAHWLMARLGKRVLRPGGVETTRWMIERAGVGPSDDVVELATGLGTTARVILASGPASYVGVERDAAAAELAQNNLAAAGFLRARVLRSDAARVALPDGAASVVFGEALLSMQGAVKKRAIFAEARRLLRPGGRYAIHELALAPDDLSPAKIAAIELDLSRSIHVGVRIGTVAQWREWLGEHGFAIEEEHLAPMRLLELDRLVQDEGLLGTARFLFNMATTQGATRRLLDVSSVFRKHQKHLCAVAFVARAKG